MIHGDVGDAKYLSEIKSRKKILLLGNHDNRAAYKDYFEEIYTGPLFIADKILLSHYRPVNLGKLIRGGILADISSIHRITIDRATERKEKWGDRK